MLISYVLFPSGFFYPIPITKRVSMNMFALGEKKNTKKNPSVAVFLAKKNVFMSPKSVNDLNFLFMLFCLFLPSC